MQENLVQKTKIGIIWNAFEKFGVQGLGFALNIILARILSPHDYGVLALLMVFVSFCQIFIEGGFVSALIQRQDRNEDDFNTAFIFNMLIAVVAYLVLFFAAPYIAKFYDIPELTLYARVLFVSLILQALTIVHMAKFQIEVNFKIIALMNLVAIFLSGVLAIILAWQDFGVWSLVWQLIARFGILAVLCWFFGQAKIRLKFSKASFKRLFGFGSKLVIVGFIGMTLMNIYNLLIAKFYDTKALGYYNQGEIFPRSVFGAISSAVSTATFPLLASLQNNRSELMRIFSRLVKVVALGTVPVMVGFAMLAEDFVLVFLTEKWCGVIPLLFWFSLSFIFTPLSALNLGLMTAIGRSDLFLKVELIKLPMTLVAMALTFPIGLEAVVIGRAILGFVAFFINTYWFKKHYDFGAFEQLWSMRKIFASTLIMAVAMYFTARAIDGALSGLIIGIIVGAIVYFGSLYALKEDEVYTVVAKIKAKFSKPTPMSEAEILPDEKKDEK